MGTKERQEREREAMRRAILDAAREMFVAEGYQNVSLRKIAERIEYSPGSIYGYFEGKDEIFYALAEEGFRLLQDSLMSVRGRANMLDGLRQGALQYYRFSREHPQYFELMFLDRSVPQITERSERFRFVGDLARRVAGTIRQCTEAGLLPPTVVPETAFHLLWAAVHGVAVLALCGPMGPGEDPDALARDAIETTIAGFKAGVATGFRACEFDLPAPDSRRRGEE